MTNSQELEIQLVRKRKSKKALANALCISEMNRAGESPVQKKGGKRRENLKQNKTKLNCLSCSKQNIPRLSMNVNPFSKKIFLNFEISKNIHRK